MKRILIIEDDLIIGNIYRGRLAKHGYEVELASDGQKGLARIREILPDCVLLDLMLPKVNGVDVLKEIRAEPAFQSLPIIVFTNAYVPKMIEDAYAAGATAVFNKATLTPRQILDALANPGTAIVYTPPPETMSLKPKASDSPPPSVNPAQASFRKTPAVSGQAAVLVGSRTSDLDVALPVDPDQAFQAELLKTFIGLAPEALAKIRNCLQEFNRAESHAAGLPVLLELYRTVHALTGSAGIAGLHQLSQLTAALEALLKELYEKPKHINASTLRTVVTAIDFLGELFMRGFSSEGQAACPLRVLVVDDDALSRRAVLHSLELVSLKAVSVENAQQALELIRKTSFDLILLDAQMPGMDGFDLCTRIHDEPKNRATPVIFVTAMTDFTSRARSTLSGGADLIGKPFLFIELGVKALIYMLRGQLAKRGEERRAA